MYFRPPSAKPPRRFTLFTRFEAKMRHDLADIFDCAEKFKRNGCKADE